MGYSKGAVAYICETTHPDNPAYEGSKTSDGEFSSTLEEDVRATCRTIDFKELQILEHDVHGNDGPLEQVLKIKVSFNVTGQKGQRQKGAEMQDFTELARFVRADESSRWLYIGGEYPDLEAAR